MSNAGSERILASRYVDGEMTGDEKIGFRRRLAEEPGLQELVREAEDLRTWFRRSSGHEPPFVASAGFTASVLAAARRLPTREELQAEETDTRAYELELVAWARRISFAAMVVLALSLLVFATLGVPRDASRLSAGTEKLKVLDQMIRDEAAGVEPSGR